MNKLTKDWIRKALARAIRTVAQSAIATIGTAAALGDVDWLMVLSVAGLSGIVSILTSITMGIPEAND